MIPQKRNRHSKQPMGWRDPPPPRPCRALEPIFIVQMCLCFCAEDSFHSAHTFPFWQSSNWWVSEKKTMAISDEHRMNESKWRLADSLLCWHEDSRACSVSYSQGSGLPVTCCLCPETVRVTGCSFSPHFNSQALRNLTHTQMLVPTSLTSLPSSRWY